MALDLGGALVGGSPDLRLSAQGTRSMGAWVDFLRDSHDFTDTRRLQLANGIYAARKQAAQAALTKEMGRLGVIKPADRARLTYLLDDHSAYAQQLRRRAEEQANRIIATDRKFRERWATARKAQTYPVSNRWQLNAELRDELEKRRPWKAEQIVATEYQQAASEAVADFYRQTGISDPDADQYWYFVGPMDKRTCGRCREIMAGNPYTQVGLVAKLSAVSAMAAEAYAVHPHERHMADYRPPRGVMRLGDNQDAAKGWARTQGNLQDQVTSELVAPPAPRTMPKLVTMRYPETVSRALVERAGAEAVAKGQYADEAARLVQQLFAGRRPGRGGKLDLLIGDGDALDVRAVSRRKRVITTGTRAVRGQEEWLSEKGRRGHLIVVADEGETLAVRHQVGLSSRALIADMPVLARVEKATGLVTPVAEALPW